MFVLARVGKMKKVGNKRHPIKVDDSNWKYLSPVGNWLKSTAGAKTFEVEDSAVVPKNDMIYEWVKI